MFRLQRISYCLIKPRYSRIPTFAFQASPFKKTIAIPTVFISKSVIPQRHHFTVETATNYEDEFCTLDFDRDLKWWQGQTRNNEIIYIHNSDRTDDLTPLLARVKTIYNDLKNLDKLAKEFMLENEVITIANWTENNVEDITMEWLDKEFYFDGIEIDAKSPNGNFLLVYGQEDIDDTGHRTDVEFRDGKPFRFNVSG